jgi:hypothetical protein
LTNSTGNQGFFYDLDLEVNFYPSGSSISQRRLPTKLCFDLSNYAGILSFDYVVVTGPPHKAGEYIPGWSNAVFEATSATIAGLSRDTTEPTVANDYDFLFTVSNSVGVVSTNVTVRVSSVASALGFDSTEVTADEIVCQVKSFGISDNCVTGTVELVAEEGGTVVQESTNISHIVKFTMLGGDTPGDMAPLPEECHAALTSRTAPFGFRVAGPVANRFFKVSLDAGRRAR